MMAVAGLFASCQSNLEPVVVDEVATVSFEVSTPQIATRAYSDGLTATQLQYAVYSVNGNVLTQIEELTVTDAEIEKTAKVDLQLTTGNTYAMIFWASEADAPYTVDFADMTMTANYNGVSSNDETLDAFYKYVEPFTVNGAMSKTVELKRPFAQLNIGTNDFEASTTAGYTPTESYVKVPAYSTLNFVDGSVEGDVTVEFASAAFNRAEEFPVDGYEYLAMNYILVGSDKETVDVIFTYTDGTTAKTRTVGSVPVQRNHRTNLYGQLLTSNVDINVEITPGFDGEFDNEGYFVEEGENGTVTAVVESANGLVTIANKINDGDLPANTNIALEGDVDLAALAPVTRSASVGTSNWSPVGTPEEPYTGTFDGRGYTIKNLTLVESEAKEGKAYIGFFGYANNATIKNVTFENVYINIPCLDIDHSQGHIGAVAGSLEGTSTIENVTVKGDITVYATQTANGASRVAVVAGGNSFGDVTMKNVHVIANEGSSLIANNNTGALAGQLQGKMVFENCSSNINVTVNKFFAGGLVGIAAGDSYFKNCHTTGDVAVVAGREGRANDHYRVGGIAGGWADGKTKVCTLENCSYAGNVSGTSADGSVAETLDYLGYVGRGYTLNNCEGSKVVIDGTEFVQVGNAAPFGNYAVNGAAFVSNGLYYAEDTKTYVVTNAEGLISVEGLIKAGTTITLAADIDLAGKEFNGLNTFHPENGNTFDGKGFVVSNWTNETGASDMGFIRNWVGTVKNLTIKNANLKTAGRSAIVAAKVYGNIENCHVVECTLEDSYWAAGLVAGLYNAGNISNCTVTGSSVKSNGGTGAIVGVINETAGTRGIYNCSVNNTTVNNTGDYGDVYSGALFCGMININNSTVEFEGCEYNNNTKVGKFVGDLYYHADDDITVVVK